MTERHRPVKPDHPLVVRQRLRMLALDLAQIEEAVACTFRAIAIRSPHLAERMLEQANAARVAAIRQRALAGRYASAVSQTDVTPAG